MSSFLRWLVRTDSLKEEKRRRREECERNVENRTRETFCIFCFEQINYNLITRGIMGYAMVIIH